MGIPRATTHFVTAAIALSTLAFVDDARACRCVTQNGLGMSPADGATDVPTNAVIFVPNADYAVSDATGAPIEIERRYTEEAFVLVPIESLPANSEIHVRSTYASLTQEPLTFTTGAAEDMDPPGAPVLSNSIAIAQPFVPFPSGANCGSATTVEPVFVERNETLVVFDVAPEKRSDVAGKNVRDLDLPLMETEIPSAIPSLGDALSTELSPTLSSFCGGALGTSGPAWVDYRVTFVDAAGNIGAWSEWQSVFLPPNLPLPLTLACTCTASPADPPVSAVFLGLALFLVAFRRSRTRLEK